MNKTFDPLQGEDGRSKYNIFNKKCKLFLYSPFYFLHNFLHILNALVHLLWAAYINTLTSVGVISRR